VRVSCNDRMAVHDGFQCRHPLGIAECLQMTEADIMSQECGFR